MNDKGSALIIVMIVCTSVFIMASACLSLSDTGAKTSESFRASANLYHLSKSGADNAVDLLNKILDLNYDKIYSDTVSAIKLMTLEDISVYYAENISDPYNGAYHLKMKDTESARGEMDKLFGTTFAEKSLAYIRADISKYTQKQPLAYVYTYNYQISGKGCYTDTPENYYINSRLEYANYINQPKYLINSAAVRENGIKTTKKETVINYKPIREIIDEAYEWEDKPTQYESGIYVNKEILNIDDLSYDNSYIKNEEILIDTGIITTTIEWTESNPVYYIYDETNTTDIDISKFYKDDMPVQTIIIDARSGGLTSLTTTEPTKNMFKGIIVSNGIVMLTGADIAITGMLLSKGGSLDGYSDCSVVTNTSGLSVFYDENAVFKAAFEDKSLYRKLLDILCITNYKGINKQKNYWSDIEALTKHAKISDTYNLHIEILDKIKFK